MNELGTIQQADMSTPFMDCCARSHAAHDSSPTYRAKRKAYREERLHAAFTPDPRWKRCIGSDERRVG